MLNVRSSGQKSHAGSHAHLYGATTPIVGRNGSMRRTILVLCLACLVALVGCGGDGGSPAPQGNSITSLVITPGRATVRPNGTRAFIYQIQGTGSPDLGVVWSTDNGTIDNNGVFSATGAPTSANVTVKSVFDPTKSATANIVISNAGPTFTIDSSTRGTLARRFIQVANNGTIDFGQFIKVVGDPNTAIQWSVVTPGGGSIDVNGLYTAPSTSGNYLIRFAAAADPTQVDYVYAVVGPLTALPVTGTITISPPITASGAPADLKAGLKYRFGYSLLLQNSNDATVIWTVDNKASIGSDGSFTAPTAGKYTVTVISRAAAISATTVVTVQ